MASHELHERDARHEWSDVQGDKRLHNMHLGERTASVEHEPTRLRVCNFLKTSLQGDTCGLIARAHAEGLQLLPDLLLRTDVHVKLGDDGVVSNDQRPLSRGAQKPTLTIPLFQELSSNIHQWRSKGFSLGHTYRGSRCSCSVCIPCRNGLCTAYCRSSIRRSRGKTNTKACLTGLRSTGLIHLHQLVKVALSPGCRAGSLALPGSPLLLVSQIPPHTCCRAWWQQIIPITNHKLGTSLCSSSPC